MLIRQNPALPPSGQLFGLMADTVCAASIVAWIRQTQLIQRIPVLARHRIDHSNATELSAALAKDAHVRREVLKGFGIMAASTGSGRRHARDCGGRILAVLDCIYRPERREYSPLDPDALRCWVTEREHAFALWLTAWPDTGKLIRQISSPLFVRGEVDTPALRWAAAQAKAEWDLS